MSAKKKIVQMVRREVRYSVDVRRALRKKAEKKGFTYQGQPSEAAYIEYLILRDLKVPGKSVQLPLNLAV